MSESPLPMSSDLCQPALPDPAHHRRRSCSPDDAWGLLDNLQGFIAARLEGMLIAHDGIYDQQLRRL